MFSYVIQIDTCSITMNPAYIGQFNPYWSKYLKKKKYSVVYLKKKHLSYEKIVNSVLGTTSTDLQYSPLMQTIPTTITSTIKSIESTSPPLFRPYNHYPLMGFTQGIHKTKPHKSAFKPVIPKSINKNIISPKSLKRHAVESTYYHLPTNVILANGNNCFGYGQAKFPIPFDPLIVSRGPSEFSSSELQQSVSSFNPITNVDKSHDTPTKQSIKSEELNSHSNVHKPIPVCQKNNTRKISHLLNIFQMKCNK